MTPRNSISSSRWAQVQLVNIARWLCMIVFAFTLSACEINEEPVGSTGAVPPTGGTPPPPPPGGMPPPPPPPPSATDQSIFEATLHPALLDQANFCAGCHGVAQDPTFAVADATVAYNAITSQQKVNLNNPALSRIYVRPKDERHNCGGDTSCDAIADTFLAAIQDWATQAAAIGPPPGGNGQPVVSMLTNFAQATDGGAARNDANAIALFTFSEGSGDVTMDTSGVGTPIALQIEGMEWVEGGGLRNVNGKAQASEADSQKLFDMIVPANEYTVEAWIIPDNNAQDGPARIVSYSLDTALRNFTMGQNAIYYQLRNDSTSTNDNGTAALEALDPQVETALQHVVMTFDGLTGRKVYINGQLGAEEDVQDTLEWENNNLLVIGNEVTNDRIWQGVITFTAIHNKALSAAEIQQNFEAGAGNIVTMRFDVSGPVGAPAFVDMQASQIDSSGYLFANPVFVSDATGVAVKNIRIGINGGVPVAAQPFRRVDMTVLQIGSTELSTLGAVIPLELGIDNDQFHLEFEVLGSQLGLAELVAASAPPAPLADVPEPELGIRTFSQINDSMSVLTGINANQNAVLARYSELRDSLPPTSDLLSFAAAQQIAIQRLATTYCGEIVGNNGTCDNFFGNCAIDGAAKDQVATTLYDRFVGDNLANQPERAGVTTEVVRMIDDLNCANGCNGAEAETVLQATCAAVLSSGALTVN